jgi:hypothetical protein
MPIGIYSTQLSENMFVDANGVLTARDCIVLASGWEMIPARTIGLLERQRIGIGDSEPGDVINAFRSRDAIYAASTVQSFKRVVLKLRNPLVGSGDELNNFTYRGVIERVRPSSYTMQAGNWPLFADVRVENDLAVHLVKDGLRDIVCVYEYSLERINNAMMQTKITAHTISLVRRDFSAALSFSSRERPACHHGTEKR